MHCIYYVYAHSMHSVLTHVYVRAMYKYSLCRIHQCMFGAAHALLYRFSPRVLHCSKECLSSIGTKKEEVAGSACVLLRVLACCTELSGQTSVPQCACCCCVRRWCALIAAQLKLPENSRRRSTEESQCSHAPCVNLLMCPRSTHRAEPGRGKPQLFSVVAWALGFHAIT